MILRKYLICCITFLQINYCIGQAQDTTIVEINVEIKDWLNNKELKIVNKFDDCLKSYNKDGYTLGANWSESQLNVCNYPDFEIISIYTQTNGFVDCKPMVLSVQKIDTFYVLKTAFFNKNKGLRSIYNIIALEEKGEFKFYNYFYFFKDKFLQKQIGEIKYYYKPSHKLDSAEINKMSKFNKELSQLFRTPEIEFSYYIHNNSEELSRNLGFDYNLTMFDSFQKVGFADINNNTIHAGIDKEYYPHELVHLYTNKLYGTTIHRFFDEGMATFLGGSLGHPLEYQLSTLKKYLKSNQVDFFNILDAHLIIDEDVNIKYAVSGLICKVMYEKEGVIGLEKLFREGNTTQDLYNALEKYLNIKRVDLELFVKEATKKY